MSTLFVSTLRYSAALAALAIALFYLFWPELPQRTYNPVYSGDFNSTLTLDSTTGNSMNASLGGRVSNSEGRGIPALLRLYRLPRQPRSIDIVAQQYAAIDGLFSLEAPAGDYELLVYKGPEYEFFRHTIKLEQGSKNRAAIKLARITNMAQRGWFGGDPHQHSAYFDGADPLDKLLQANAGVGLHFSVQTDHNKVGQNPIAKAYVAQSGLDSDSGHPYLAIGGDEISTSIGHMNVWEPMQSDGQYIHIDDSAPPPEAALEEKTSALQRMQSDMEKYARFKVINHPAGGNVAYANFGEKRGDSFMDVDFDWIEHRDLILGFDATESWNGGSGFMDGMYYFGAQVIHPFESMERVFHEWFRLLNSGARLPSLGSSDTHDAYVSKYLEGYDQLVEGARTLFLAKLPRLTPQWAQRIFGDLEAALLYQHLDSVEYQLEEIGLLPGSARTYIYTGGELDTDALIANAGRSFVTNGPLILATLDGAMPGETAALMDENTLRVELVSNKPLSRLLVISDGELVHERSLGNIMRGEELIALGLSGRKWLLVYVEGPDNYAHAFTNPIYLR